MPRKTILTLDGSQGWVTLYESEHIVSEGYLAYVSNEWNPIPPQIVFPLITISPASPDELIQFTGRKGAKIGPRHVQIICPDPNPCAANADKNMPLPRKKQGVKRKTIKPRINHC